MKKQKQKTIIFSRSVFPTLGIDNLSQNRGWGCCLAVAYTAKSQFLLRIILLILRKKITCFKKKITCFKKILGKPKWLTIRTLLVLRKKIMCKISVISA